MKNSPRKFLFVVLIGPLLALGIVAFVNLGPTSVIPWLMVLVTVVAIVFLRRQKAREFVQWKDEYSLGIEDIDSDHRKLISLINDLETAVHYCVGDEFEREALEALVSYTQTHFKLEEDLMEEHGYPDFEAHKGQHDQMISNVEVYLRNYEKHGSRTLDRIAVYLRLWLIQHINHTDRKYVAHLQAKGVK